MNRRSSKMCIQDMTFHETLYPVQDCKVWIGLRENKSLRQGRKIQVFDKRRRLVHIVLHQVTTFQIRFAFSILCFYNVYKLG
jgi:hypothetical protein